MIDLPPQDLTTIKRVLARHVPNCEVRAFGSRVTWTAKPHSDLDLVVVAKEKLPRSLLSTLKGEFEDSAVPVTVDLLDWRRISPEFQKNIEKQYETIQNPHEGKSIPEGWAYRKVAEIAEVMGGGTPKTKKDDYWGGDIPWLTPKDLSGEHPRYVSRGERNITKTGLENSSARIVPPKTVLLTSRAPVGYVAMAKNPITTNQGFRSLVVNHENDPEFVYYLLINNTDYLKQHAAGSTFQELSGGTLKSLDFLMPPLPDQKAIAHILGTLDDKIELNRRTNETLEAMARALFKSWFVDFDPVRRNIARRQGTLDLSSVAPAKEDALFPDSFVDSELGRIPKGWRVRKLAEILEFAYGKALRAEDRQPGDVPVFGSNGQVGWHAVALVQQPGVIVGRKDNPGIVKWSHTPFFPMDTTFYVVVKEKTLTDLYLLFELENQNLPALGADSAVPGLNRNLAYMSSIAVPPPEIVGRFQTITGGLFDAVHHGEQENRSLAAARDALLPKLLSGEIRIKDAEKFVEDAA